jgi:hypothetical protein
VLSLTFATGLSYSALFVVDVVTLRRPSRR